MQSIFCIELHNNVIFMENEKIGKTFLRPLKDGDLEKIFGWRNHPEIRSQMFDPSPLEWEKHKRFWNSILGNRNRKGFIIMDDNEECGIVRIDIEGQEGEIDIFVSVDHQRKGIGSRALGLAIEESRKLELKILKAKVKAENEASRKIFQGNGFKAVYINYELKI